MKNKAPVLSSQGSLLSGAFSRYPFLMQTHRNVPLIVGIGIPVAMILFVAASIYLPGLFIKPQYGFLYANNPAYVYDCQWRYEVQNQHLMKIANPLPTYRKNFQLENCEATFTVYDVKNDTNRIVTFEEAQKLTLDSSITSPDGFEVVRGGSGGGGFFLFDIGGRDYNSSYLKGHNLSKKINLTRQNTSNYYGNYSFLGWIL
jgi:hypothetical protein